MNNGHPKIHVLSTETPVISGERLLATGTPEQRSRVVAKLIQFAQKESPLTCSVPQCLRSLEPDGRNLQRRCNRVDRLYPHSTQGKFECPIHLALESRQNGRSYGYFSQGLITPRCSIFGPPPGHPVHPRLLSVLACTGLALSAWSRSR